MKVEISVPEVVSIFKEIQDPWIFDKTKRPATGYSIKLRDQLPTPVVFITRQIMKQPYKGSFSCFYQNPLAKNLKP
jgi:hypothetical protein